MKKIYFAPRRKNRAGQIIAFSLAFLLLGGVITLLNKDKAIDLTGMAIYSTQDLLGGAALLCESCSSDVSVQMQGQLSKENTEEGLVIEYGELKQEPIEIGVPVKWKQKLFISNPGHAPAKEAQIQLEVPADAFNVNVFMYGAKLSEGRVLKIPYFAPRGNVEMLLTFETAPIEIEFVEEKRSAGFPKTINKESIIEWLSGAKTKVVIGHNSSMHYYNVPVEMDIKLGEKIVELSESAEKGIEFDYASGKARWVIEEI
ncbi:MAG: hypothetical protein KJ955_06210 [Nanoarchaeota archaeon]|nr:hypothetical protein [Nanoarchaeota archaeon]